VSNVPRLRLEEEEKVAISLCSFIIGEESELHVVVVQMRRDLVLLLT